jgi:hypothetical protein
VLCFLVVERTQQQEQHCKLLAGLHSNNLRHLSKVVHHIFPLDGNFAACRTCR